MNKIRYFVLIGISIMLIGSQLACQETGQKNPKAQEKQDTVMLSQLYFDKVKFKYLPKELEGSIVKEGIKSDGIAGDAGLDQLQSIYFKSYLNPDNDLLEAAVRIYELPTKAYLDERAEACAKAAKNTNCLSAITVDRFLILFFASDFDAASTDRKIFEDFYVPKGGKIIFQAQAAVDEVY